MALLHYSLAPGGRLLLGCAESIDAATEFFAPLPGKTWLYEAFHWAMRDKKPVTLKAVKVSDESPVQYVDIVVQPLHEPVDLRGLALIVFHEVPKLRQRRSFTRGAGQGAEVPRADALAQELQQLREEAKSVREEMQTSQKELKSSNEELQSMNEELQTVNHELQAKVVDLARASDDRKNLLDSTEIATLFLDDALHVRRFTPQTTRIIKLIAGDRGRPITDIVSELIYPELARDAHEVLRTLVFCENDVPAAAGR